MNYIGIDIGTTNIKIIETDKNLNILNKQIFEKQDPNNALKNFIENNNINLNSIEKIMVTGVGISKLNNTFENIEIKKVPEFIAISNAGEYALKETNYLVASVGTGTAFIKNKDGKNSHVGGTGVGGGTLINLCKKIIPKITFEKINSITKTNSLENVDLWIKDVTDAEIKTLPKDITAVNLGKLNKNTNNEDLILGIVNMVFETIGVMAAFAAKGDNITNVVVLGQLVKMPFARKVLNKIEFLHNVKFIIPENPEYIVALGAIMNKMWI